MFPKNSVRNSLLYKFLAINIFAFAIMAAFVYQGWIQAIFENDSTHITMAIGFLFIVGLSISFKKVLELNWLQTELIKPYISRSVLNLETITYHSITMRGVANISVVSRLGATMLLLGISGTVVGLIIALSQVTPDAAKNVNLVGPMAATLLHGVSIKLATTLVGIVGNIWTIGNYHILAEATQKIIAKICEIKGI